MSSVFERLAQGPNNLQQGDYDNWNQMVGAAPPEQFGRATYNAIRQVDPQEYAQHAQPGVNGTDPFGALASNQRTDLAQSLISTLLGRGVPPQQVQQGAGLPTLDPGRMSPQDLAALAQWTQQNHPKAFGYVAAQHQDQPDVISSLLGNKALMLLVAGLGAKVLSDQMSQRRQQPSNPRTI